MTKLLLVEDDIDVRRNLKSLLEAEGYDVSLAGDGHEALNVLRNGDQKPALILLDVMLPNMNGFEFREAQLQDPSLADIPVVIMSADGQIDEKRVRMAARGAIRKPADVGFILDTIKAAIG